MKKYLFRMVAVLLFAPFFGNSLLANAGSAPDEPTSIFTLGVYGEAGSNALIGKEQILPFPSIYYHNKYLTLETTNIAIHPIDTGWLQVSAIGSLRVSDIEMSSDDRFDEFDRDFAFEAGGRVSASYSGFSMYGQYLTEVTDAHGGEEITIGLSWEGQVKNLFVGLDGGAHHRSSELATFLYGVRSEDTASGFSETVVEKGWYGFAEATVTYPLNNHWAITVRATGEKLPKDVKASPIVDKDYTIRGGIGLSYSF